MDRTDPTIRDLVEAAKGGDRAAWDNIVDRYTPLVLSVTRKHAMNWSDAADVAQTVWLKVIQHLDRIREPDALPGWISTTTRHECLRVLTARQRLTTYDPLLEVSVVDHRANRTNPDPDADLLRAERHEALLAGFAELPDTQRVLLQLLLRDPPLSYAEIARRMGITVGAIGPTRQRALQRLRRSPALAALLLDERH